MLGGANYTGIEICYSFFLHHLSGIMVCYHFFLFLLSMIMLYFSFLYLSGIMICYSFNSFSSVGKYDIYISLLLLLLVWDIVNCYSFSFFLSEIVT